MQDIKENLENAMCDIDVSQNIIDAFRELCYTASETRLIGFEFKEDAEIESMIQLVLLAKKYKKGVPNKFRL